MFEVNLIKEIEKAIIDAGESKSSIAYKLGISRQNFSGFLRKKNFSLKDANRILDTFGYEAIAVIRKKEDREKKENG